MLENEQSDKERQAALREELRVPSKEVLRASGQVQSLSRALKLLNALSYHASGLSLSEVAQEVGLPNSTAHRLLTTLQNERFVRFDGERSVWMVGVQAFRVGSAFVRSRDMVSIARPYMRRLMEQAGETVNLGILDRDEIVYLAQVECQKMMRAIAGPGGRAQPHCSGVGKAIMSRLDPEAARKLLEETALTSETHNTLVKVNDVLADLAKCRERGFAIDDEENAIGLRCVAACICNEHGEPIGAISISGPSARITDQRLPVLGGLANKFAKDITAELGGKTLQE
jgi:IclR family acetate operon transcriptional repressor